MSDDAAPNPYGADAQGQAQIKAEAEMLTESYGYASQREISQQTLSQHQARIAELLQRQSFRTETGQAYLHQPVQTRITQPAPAPVPEPPPAWSPMRILVDGQHVELSAPQPEPEEDAGMTQMLDEMEQLFQVRERAASGAYKTPDEWRQLQQAENALSERQRWREATGQRFITDGICRRD